MMIIKFNTDSDLKDYLSAIKEYQKIWEEDGKRIVEVWESTTGMTFREKKINAIVFEGISHSHPLSLRYNLDIERKRSVLIHEIGHRLIHGRTNQVKFSSLNNHKTLFLALYDVFVSIYGKKFANEAVAWDKKLPRDTYKKAWDWALSFTKEERAVKFKKRMKQS